MNRIIRLRLSILGVVALVASLIVIQPSHSQFQGRPGGISGMPGRPPGIPGGISGGIAGRPGFSGISGAGGIPGGIGGPPPGFSGVSGAGGIVGRPGISGISGAGGIAGRPGFSGISGMNGAGGFGGGGIGGGGIGGGGIGGGGIGGGGMGGPAAGIAGDFPRLPPIQQPDFGPLPRAEMPRMADPSDFPKPHRDILSANVMEWSCSNCNKVLGTGEYAPSYTRCPGCGVRLKRGGSSSGDSGIGGGVLLFFGVLAVVALIFSGVIYLGVKLVGSQMKTTPKTYRKSRKRQSWLDDDEDDRPRRRKSRQDFDD